MTPDKLHEARKAEAIQQAWSKGGHWVSDALDTYARLVRENWTPVDPDIEVVRAVLHAHQRAMTPPDSGWGDMSYAKGSYDNLPVFQAALGAYRVALAALRRGRELERGE